MAPEKDDAGRPSATPETQKSPNVTGHPPPKEPYFTFEQVREAAFGKVFGLFRRTPFGDAGEPKST
jgi:hypothetical protein